MSNNNNNEEEEMIEQIGNFIEEVSSYISDINQVLPRLHNIEYNSQSNTTSIYGHTNFEELKVNNTNVSLNGHTHNANNVNYTYEEEEEYEEETINEEEEVVYETKTRNVTRSVPLNNVLSDAKSTMTTNTNNIDTMATSINTLAESIQDYIEAESGTYQGDTVTVNFNLGTSYVKKTDLATSVTTSALTVNGNASATGTIVGSNVLSNNETRLAAAEGNITSLQSGKANASHTHAISDITNLQTTLDGKAASSHNHDSTYAKLAADNTFTGSNTFTATNNSDDQDYICCRNSSSNIDRLRISHRGLIHIDTDGYDSIDAFKSNIVENKYNRIRLGKEGGTNQNALISFMYKGDNSADNYLTLGMDGNNDSFRLFNNRAECMKMMYITLGSAHKINALTMSLPNTLNNGDFLREIFTDGTKMGYLSFTKDDQEYKMKLGIDSATANMIVSETYVSIAGTLTVPSITLNGNDLATLLSGKASTSHTHDYSSTYAALSHTHNTTDISRTITTTTLNSNNEEVTTTATIALNDILDDKSDVGHGHTISDVSGLQTALDGKASSSHNHDAVYAALNHNHDSTYAPLSHSHGTNDITNLQTFINSCIDAKKDELFQEMYPVGSLFITYRAPENFTNLTLNLNGNEVSMTLHGCTFSLLRANAFIKQPDWSISIGSGSSTRLARDQEAMAMGGNATHNHEYKLKSGLFYDVLCAGSHHGSSTGGLSTYNYLTGNWEPGINTGNVQNNEIISGSGMVQISNMWELTNTANTSTVSNLPPYITMWMWRRVA